jgi:hypothetical protein
MNQGRPAPVTRRTVVTAGVAGTAVGFMWSGGFAWANKVREPVVDVIGQDESQLALLDTGRERVLILSGPPNDRMLEELPGMLGLFRRRIDLVLATESVFRSQLGTLRSISMIGSTIALPEAAIPASPHADATLTMPVEMRMSNDVTLRCYTHSRSTDNSTTGWRVEVQRGEAAICIAGSLNELAAVPARRFAMAIAPVGTVTLASRKSVAAAFALNTGR